jgi:hypothetical protein
MNTQQLTFGSVQFMVFNATLSNISVISWRSVLLAEETGVPGENHRPVTDKLYHIMLYGVLTHSFIAQVVVYLTTIRSRPR